MVMHRGLNFTEGQGFRLHYDHHSSSFHIEPWSRVRVVGIHDRRYDVYPLVSIFEELLSGDLGYGRADHLVSCHGIQGSGFGPM